MSSSTGVYSISYNLSSAFYTQIIAITQIEEVKQSLSCMADLQEELAADLLRIRESST